MGIKLSALTKKELERIKAEANFTQKQLMIYEELNKDEVYDQGIMLKLMMSAREYYELKKIVVDKVIRLALELGYTYAIKPKENRENSDIKPQEN
jgi:hypothetical protein